MTEEHHESPPASTPWKSKFESLLVINAQTKSPSLKFRLLFIISISFTILAIVLSLVIAMQVYMMRDVSYNIPFKGNSTTKIALVTHYIDVDAIAGTLTADWYPLPEDCKNPEEVVNIYFDRNTLKEPGVDPNKIASDQQPEQPIFQFNTKTRCHENVRNGLATFRTVTKLIGQGAKTKWTGPSLQWYPLDVYFAQFSIFAQLNSTNASVGIITNPPFGSPVNVKVTLDKKMSINTDDGLYIRLDVRRSGAVQLLVMIIVLANWLATVAFLWITVASFLWPERVVTEMFAIPIAALFAFTSVRSTMPGAPAGFGAFIDFIGILPNIASMAVFSATLLLVVLIRRIRSEVKLQKQRKKGEPRSESGIIEEQQGKPSPPPPPPLDNDSVRRLLVLMEAVMAMKTERIKPDQPQDLVSPPVVLLGDDVDNPMPQLPDSEQPRSS